MTDIDDKKSNRANGGHARAAALPAEERSSIASAAAKARWAARATPVEGNIPKVLEGYASTLDLVGVRLPCAVIEGPNGIQRVLSETGIAKAILGGRSGASRRAKQAASEGGSPLPLFVAPKQLKDFVTSDLLDGPLKPIDFLLNDRVVRGYDASVLVAVCKIWLKARQENVLQKQQLQKAQQAEILLGALADTGVVALIDEATGYEKVRPQNALQSYLELVVRKELAAWSKKFPDEFYENIYKLRGWKWPGMAKNRFSIVAHYTNDLIYRRLGPGLLEELTKKTPKNEKGYRDDRFHQWFTEDIGDPLLAQHMHAIIMFQRFAIANAMGWNKFMATVDQVLPKKGSTLELPLSITDSTASPPQP